MGKLNALAVSNMKAAGLHGDGGGLYLKVDGSSKTWVFRYRSPLTGKTRYKGLGAVRDLSLADARDKASDLRRLLNEHVDPIEAEKAAQREAQAAQDRRRTVEQVAEEYVATRSARVWSSGKYRKQWLKALQDHAFPTLGKVYVDDWSRADTIRAVGRVWNASPITGRRVLQRLSVIADFAVALGYRREDMSNPASGRILMTALAPLKDIHTVQNLAAVPWQELPALVAKLRQRPGVAARALEFQLLTVTRSSEACEARWSEMDMTAGIWRLPASRTKQRQAHTITLSPRALAIIRAQYAARPEHDRDNDGYVFATPRKGHIHSDAPLVELHAVGYQGATAHATSRAAFKSWSLDTARDQTITELCLGHAIGNKVSEAYRRTDVTARRAELLRQWAGMLDGEQQGAQIVAFPGAATA